MFNDTVLTLNSGVDQDTYMFGLHKRSISYRCKQIKPQPHLQIRLEQA